MIVIVIVTVGRVGRVGGWQVHDLQLFQRNLKGPCRTSHRPTTQHPSTTTRRAAKLILKQLARGCAVKQKRNTVWVGGGDVRVHIHVRLGVYAVVFHGDE